MKDWLLQNLTKVFGSIVAVLGTLQTLVSTGGFEGLLEPSGIRWMNIWIALLTTLFGGATVARGFNNSTKEKVAAAMQDAINAPPPKQTGFARPSFLAVLFALTVPVVAALSGCTGTRAAYKEAQSPDEYAYVLAEHYASLVREAADLKARPTTPADVVRAMQTADTAAAPLVDALRPLRGAYLATQSAASEAELQEAINRAVLAIADLVRSVKAARGTGSTSLLERRILFDAERLQRSPA